MNQIASALAPMLYFEAAGALGHMNGLIRVTLEASTLIPEADGSVTTERVIVAHMRMNVPAAESLKTALESALLMAQPPAREGLN